MIAARKMMTPGVLTHEKEVVLALGEVLIWTVELKEGVHRGYQLGGEQQEQEDEDERQPGRQGAHGRLFALDRDCSSGSGRGGLAHVILGGDRLAPA